MDRETIDQLWQTAMRQSIEDGEQFTRYHFAKLVAKHSASVEREACAQLVEELPAPSEYSMTGQSMWDVTCIDCAAAIRERGNNA